MKRAKEKETKLSLPRELIQKVISYSTIDKIMGFIPGTAFQRCICETPEIWNKYAGTEGLEIDDCIGIIQKQRTWRDRIRRDSCRTIEFATGQSDMTQIIVKSDKIFTSSDDATVKMFDFRGVLSKIYTAHTGGVWVLEAFGDYIFTGSTDKTARIWDINSGICIRALKYHRSTVRVLKVFGDYIITGSRDHTIVVWNIYGEIIHTLIGHTQSVRCMDVYENYLASGSYDGTVKIWDYVKGRLIRNANTHKNRVYAVRIFKNYVVSCGLDSEVKISTLDGRESFSHTLHTSMVAWIDVLGPYIVTSGIDGEVVKYNFIDRRAEYKISLGSPIKSQKIFGSFLIIGTISEVMIYSFRSGRFIKKLFKADTIIKVEAVDWKIVVGFCIDKTYKVAVFDYENID